MLNLTEILTQNMTAVSAAQVLITIAFTVVLGLLIGFTYYKTTAASDYSQALFNTMVMLPILISLIILFIGSNVAGAFSLAGAFSIIRFRSAPGNPKDISYVLFAVAAGLACGIGFYIYALLFTAVICVLIAVFKAVRLGVPKATNYLLKITIPENLNFAGIFDPILDEYTKDYSLTKVKTADMGSVFELSYDIVLPNGTNTKEFMDKVRTRNGNLTVLLSLASTKTDF